MYIIFVKRLFETVITLLVLLFAMFFATYVMGDPTQLLLPPEASQTEVEELREYLGLNDPFYVQYFNFLKGVLHGNVGTSFYHEEDALRLVLELAGATVQLAGISFLFALVISIPLGVFVASRRGSWLDRGCLIGSLIGISVPTFWLGIVLILIFSVTVQWLPSSGRGGVSHLILPGLTLGLYNVALFLRLIRAGMLDVLGEDYIRTAKSKGLPHWAIIYKHGLRNALIPFVTITALQFGQLIGFSTVTETVFAWPGMGRLLLKSLEKLDYPVLIAYVLVIGVMFAVLNMFVDWLYTVLDPRVRYE